MERTMGFNSTTGAVKALVMEFVEASDKPVERKELVAYINEKMGYNDRLTDGVIAGAIKILINNGELVTVRRGCYEKGSGKTKSSAFEKIYGICERFSVDLDRACTVNIMDLTDKKDGGVKEFSMYVITNEYGVNGAAAVMYKGALANLAEHLDSNLLIFPSSTHEVLLIPFGNKSEVTSDAEWIVRAVNRSDVHEIERLSDRAYFYDKDKCELSFALPREGEEQIVIQL